MIKDINESSFSDDYEWLVELMQKQSVVCVVDFNFPDSSDHPPSRDIAKTSYDAGSLQVGARGIGYLWAETKEEFIEQCKRRNLKFLP